MKKNNRTKKQQFDYRILIFFIIIYILIMLPSIIKIFKIQELYSDKEIRGAVVDGMFYIRDKTGYGLADIRVIDIEKEKGTIFRINYVYHYMGNIDRRQYSDVDEIIYLKYDMKTKNKSITIEKNEN